VDLDSLRWGVIAKVDEAEAMAPLGEYVKSVLAWSVGLSLLATLLGLLLAQLMTRPITALVRAAKQVSEGALDVEVEVIATDEYRELGDAFNQMVASLRHNREKLDLQVLENERLLVSLLPASGAAHVRDGNADARQSFADVTVAYVNPSDLSRRPISVRETDGPAERHRRRVRRAAEQHGVEKVRTIGPRTWPSRVAGGAPRPHCAYGRLRS
jgi:HAMP domain-containing protein